MEDFDDPDLAPCPRCDGWGFKNCYCGGDQCYCENNGEEECSLCEGEGQVLVEVHDRWLEQRRAYYASITKDPNP